MISPSRARPIRLTFTYCPSCRIELCILPNSTCLSTEGKVGSDLVASRVVSLGNQTLSTLLAEELRVRARDIAFERAVTAAVAAR